MRIGYYLHHQGEGHRRRGTAVARELTVPVTGLGTGPAPQGWPGEWVSLAPDDDPVVGDPDWADVTAGDALHWVPRHHPGLLERHRQIVDWLARERPALLVVDVSVEVVLLARLCGIPVVVGAMPGDRDDAAHALAYDVAEALLAPWPSAAHPGSGWRSTWWEKTWHVGGISALAGSAGAPPTPTPPISTERTVLTPPTPTTPISTEHTVLTPPAEGRDDHGPGREGRVLVLWGSGGDPLTSADLACAAAATPGWRWTVRGGGYPPAEDLAADLAAADVVVSHAGQGSVADIAWAGRPAVVLAQPRPFDEQYATVRALNRLGLAATDFGWPQEHEWPQLLARALELGGECWPVWGATGATVAAARLQDLAGRVGPRGRVSLATMGRTP